MSRRKRSLMDWAIETKNEWVLDFVDKDYMQADAVPSLSSSAVHHWRCTRHPEHKWTIRLGNVRPKNLIPSRFCPYCAQDYDISLLDWCTNNDMWWMLDFVNGEKNDPRYTPALSPTVVHHWQCPRNPAHKWAIKLANIPAENMTEQTFCPECLGQTNTELQRLIALQHDRPSDRGQGNKRGLEQAVPGVNDLQTLYPGLAAQYLRRYDPDCPEDQAAGRKVNTKPVDQVLPGSNMQAYWQCDSKTDPHIWMAQVSDRTGRPNAKCPYCKGTRTWPGEELGRVYPELTEYFSPKNKGTMRDYGGKLLRDRNGKTLMIPLSVMDVSSKSQKRFIWQLKDGTERYCTIADMLKALDPQRQGIRTRAGRKVEWIDDDGNSHIFPSESAAARAAGVAQNTVHYQCRRAETPNSSKERIKFRFIDD